MGVAVDWAGPVEPLRPGDPSTHVLRLRNTGATVDRVSVDVVGEPSGWTTVDQPTHNLLPGEEVEVQVTFTPPRSSSLVEGRLDYAIRAMSHEDTAGSVIDEHSLAIGAFSEIVAELVPHTSTGRRCGRHQLAIDNLGNHQHLMSLKATDPDAKLAFEFAPANPRVEPGTAIFVKVLAKPKDTFLRGSNVTLPFELVLTPKGQEPVTLRGTMVQTPILPAWLMKAAAIAVAAVVALLVLWFTVFRPTVEATAKAVAEDETEELAAAIAQASEDAAAARAASGGGANGQGNAKGGGKDGGKAGGDKGTGGKGSGGTGTGGTGTGGTGTGGTAGINGTLDARDAIGFRVTADVRPRVGFQRARYVPEDETTIWVSDMLLQNPAGDAGTLRIQRGDDVLMVFGLQNFRDLDYHFIQPLAFTEDEPIIVSVNCRNETDPCTPSVYFAGRAIEAPKPRRTGG